MAVLSAPIKKYKKGARIQAINKMAGHMMCLDRPFNNSACTMCCNHLLMHNDYFACHLYLYARYADSVVFTFLYVKHAKQHCW